MRTRKQLLSLLLCGVLLFSVCSPSAFAEAQTIQDSGQITADVQAKIDALPEAVTEDNRAAIVFDGLSIGGKEVTEGNANDVLGDGSVSYDAASDTITLKDCKLSEGQIVYKGAPGGKTLTIELVGENSLQMIDIHCYRLVIQGPGSLAIRNEDSSCIFASGEVAISGGATVTAESTDVKGYGIYTASSIEISSGSTVNVTSIYTGLQGGTGIFITENSMVNILSSADSGIYSLTGKVEINDSTVTAVSGQFGICSSGNSIEISNSKVKAESTYEIDGRSFLPGMYGKTGVIITNCTGDKEVTAISASGCGIWSEGGFIEIDNSKVTVQGYYPGLSGYEGVVIRDGSNVKATSSDDCGIFSAAAVEIDSSQVDAQSYYAGLQGNQGVSIRDSNDIKAISSGASGIFSPATIEINHSQVDAQGYYAGLDTRADGSISITDGSKISAVATMEDSGSGIYTQGDFEVEDSEIYADGSFRGIYFEGKGNVFNSCVRAENNIGMGGGDYKPTNSVTIQSGKWWIAGDAKIPDGDLVKEGDTIRIPAKASLSIGETGTKIQGEVNGIIVDNDGALLLPAGTIIVNSDNTWRVIGTGNGKITLEGEVFDFSVYTITVEHDGSGTASASPTSAKEGTEITLTARADNGYHFDKWQVMLGIVTINDDKFTMPAENVIVKAIFEEDTYNVTLISNGGTINSGNVTEYTYGVGATLPTDMSKEGYVFAGWYQNSDCSGSPVPEISKTDMGNKMFYAKWVSTDAGVTEVSVDETAGTVSGSTITVVLPYGTASLPTKTDKVSITPADGATVSNLQLAESDGSKWTFTVTAEDETVTKDYIIRVSIAPDPAAENKTAIAAVKSTIEARNWTVEQTAANTNEAVKDWIENQLNGMNLNGVGCTVSITDFIAATAGSSTDADGTDGSFTFTVSLSKGENSTLAQGITKAITGKVTATAYQSKSYTVSVSASPTVGGTVSGSGTFEENASVKVSAVAKDGYHFVKWTEGSSDVSTNADYTFILTGDRTLVAVFEKDSDPTPPQEYTVTVQAETGGTVSGSGTFEENAPVTVTAAANNGYHFVRWTENHKEVSTSTSYTFTITGDRTLVAVFEKDSDPTPPQEYTVSVQAETGGTVSGSGTFEENASVTVTAAANSGYHFVRWTEDHKEVSTSTSYTFTVTGDRTLVAVFEPVKPEIPTTGQTKPVTLDTDGNAAVDNGAVQSAINAAKNDAKKNGNTANGVEVVIPITSKAGQNSFNVTINAQTLNTLVRENVKRLEINIEGVVVGGMDTKLLKWLDTLSANGDVIFRVKQTDPSGLSKEAKAAIGTRPVYELSLVYLSGGKEIPITDFDGHTIAVRLPYTLAKGEQAGNLYAVYVDEKGKVEWLTKSSYAPDLNAVIFETGHFSIYGIGYKNPAPAFTDIKNHWAEDNIIFAASRGLLTGTGNNQFSPDTGMTRGMFVTALGRLAGIDPDSYKTGKFTDVKADAYYAPYANWAAEKGIVNGTTATTFSPDTNITREQMAVIMAGYAKKPGYELPVAHDAVTFADNAQISGWAAKEVKAMQQAGIMAGKGGNRFDPKETATRAEVTTVLRRFVEIVIDPQTAQGWVQNHSGSWQYMKNGKPAIGWLQDGGKWYWLDNEGWMFAGGFKQIGGKWYYFYSDGSMAVNITIDGYTIGPDGARKYVNGQSIKYTFTPELEMPRFNIH